MMRNTLASDRGDAKMRIGNRPDGLPVYLSIGVPDRWDYKETFTIFTPDRQANILFSSESLSESVTTEEYAAVQGDLLEREFPGYRQISYEEFSLLDAGVAWLRVFEWSPPDPGPPVTQMQVYYVASGRGITSTATASSMHFPEVQPNLLDVLRSIAVVEEPTAAAKLN
jgi:hypothetical protein